MDRIQITFMLDLTNGAPSGAGWYWYSLFDGKPVGEPVFVSEEIMERIAWGVDTNLGPDAVKMTEMVQSGNKLMYNVLERQLQEAEEQASRIGLLRKRLSELKNETNETE